MKNRGVIICVMFLLISSFLAIIVSADYNIYLISGEINESDYVKLDPITLLRYPPEETNESTTSNYSIELYDNSSSLIRSFKFPLWTSEPIITNTSWGNFTPFLFLLNVSSDILRFDIKKNNETFICGLNKTSEMSISNITNKFNVTITS